MKKIIFIASAAAVLSLAISCQPQLLKGGSPDKAISEADLSSAFVITGYYEDEACTKKVGEGEGNYVTYTTEPAMNVQVCYVKGGSETILATGPSGVFYLLPKRKANPVQPFTIKAINQDGSIVTADKTCTVFVPTKLKPEMELLVSDAGMKSWTWNTDAECWFYGEGGNTGAGADFIFNNFDGAWWGASSTEDFEDYAWISASGEVEGDMDADAWMTLDEEGNSVVYDAEGNEIRRGTFELKYYDPDHKNSKWEMGQVFTNKPCTLCPYCIHEEAKLETWFQLMYLDGTYMAWADPESSETGDWDNITYWMFKVKE